MVIFYEFVVIWSRLGWLQLEESWSAGMADEKGPTLLSFELQPVYAEIGCLHVDDAMRQ